MLKKMVIFAGVFLYVIWMAVHWDRITGDADAVVRFTLGFLFAILVILRRKDPEKVRIHIPDVAFPVFLGLGTLGALTGIIFTVHMFEWAGVLALVAACCLWASPRHYRGDILLAFFVLFWVHPLPGQVFGWMQSWMQHLSVMGSEIVLHTLNVRVWGDGTVLRAGFHNFLVPEACSGMRTSVTVFMCALGVGLLLRLKFYEILSFIVLGLLQVLLLNITRISFMVVWAPRMPPEWAENFLHDSLGIFLMIAVVLVQFEAALWCWWSRRRAYIRDAIARKEVEPTERASIIPHVIRQFVFVMVIVSGVALVGFGIFAIFYKTRAFHRKEMIREVAEELLARDAVTAERAVREARSLFPDERELLSLHGNAMIQLGRFDEGLALLEQIIASGAELNLQEKVLMGWALSRDGKLNQARDVIGGLGPEHDSTPGVAMLKAEFAAMDDDPAAVAKYIVVGAQSRSLLPRVRALFPYLAAHEQWKAIAESDHDVPYHEMFHALIALHANQQVDDLSGLTRTMRQTLSRWPLDASLLGALFDIAVRRQDGGEWELYFENNLRANLSVLRADALSRAAGYSWRLGRPDLAWQVYSHLQRVSPNDPELLAAPAQYSFGWTRFRRRGLGVPADDVGATIDIRPVLDFMQHLEPIGEIRSLIPMYEEAEVASSPIEQKRLLENSLAELAKRESEGPLGMRLLRLYPVVLSELGRYEEAHSRLDQMLIDFPEMATEIHLQHAIFYDKQQRWVNSYEQLRAFRQIKDIQNLTADLLEVSALMNMNMAVAALELITDARDRFPGAVRLDLAESALWDVFGFKAQALHILRRTKAGNQSAAAVELLESTGRIEEAERLRSSLGVSRNISVKERPLWLPAADFVLTPRWPPPPNAAEIKSELAVLREQQREAGSSSFVGALRSLQVNWYESLQTEGYSVVASNEYVAVLSSWAKVGRFDAEITTALYQLGMYAARQKDYGLASAALARAGEVLPENPAIWRARIAMDGNDDPELVDQAWRACPDDTEIFLAALVSHVGQLDGDAAIEEITAFVEAATESAARYPIETLVRAGSYLLSQGWRKEVIPLARAVEDRAESLLAAHVFVMRCAMMNNKSDWALAATLRAIPLGIDKTPFYRTLIDLKIARREIDGDLMEALEYLQERLPGENQWAEALGSLYFQRGDLQRSLAIFSSVIDEDIRGVQVRSLLLAAEAARLENRIERAVRILEAAYALRPDQPNILNNLVYQLAQRDETLPRAQELLPKLLEIGNESFAVLDTAAVVAMRSGNLEQAKAWMEQALDSLDDEAYGAYEVRLNLAELHMRQGFTGKAREALQNLRQDSARPDYVDRRARQMLRDIDMGL